MRIRNRAVCRAGMAGILLVTVLTVAGELAPGFQRALVVLTGHHWVTKSVLAILVFLGVLVASSRGAEQEEADSGGPVVALMAAALACSAMVFGFFTLLYALH